MKDHDRVRYLRKNILHQTQMEFAKSIKISRSNLGNIETGSVSLTDRVKNDICTIWGIRMDWLENGGPDDTIFRTLTEDEEIALCASELLEKSDDNVYSTIIEFIKVYRKLDDSSKLILNNMCQEIIDKLKK